MANYGKQVEQEAAYIAMRKAIRSKEGVAMPLFSCLTVL